MQIPPCGMNNNTIIQIRRQQQQQKRWKSLSTLTSSSSTYDKEFENDEEDYDKNEKEEVVLGDDFTTSPKTKSEDLLPEYQPWLMISQCNSRHSFSEEEIQNNESPNILRSSALLNWKIPHPDDIAGIVFLGPNGIGKSQSTQSIIGNAKWYIPGEDEKEELDGDNDTSTSTATTTRPIPKWSPRIQHVSFEAHQELLVDKNLGVLKCIADGGQLNKAAQFLIVRLGLYSLLKRNITTLSTGEIRKVMLVRALSRRPDLLILDNALDGLDVKSRDNLKDIIRKTLMGFTQDILVQGINAKATARTQVMLLTHRSEEIVTLPNIDSTVTYPVIVTTNNDSSSMELKTEAINKRSSDELLKMAMNLEEDDDGEERQQQQQQPLMSPWDDPTLPVSKEMIESWWQSSSDSTQNTEPIVNAEQLTITRTKIDENDSTTQSTTIKLLDDLDWSIYPGETWLLAGHNGAGKSTLSRLLVKQQDEEEDSDAFLDNLSVPDPTKIGWCSTELHMQMSSSTIPAIEVLTRDYTTDTSIAMQMAEWMRLPSLEENPKFWDRPFHQLSQGQQKMVLITAAIACQPRLLILDEPCQGLDLLNRRRVLSMMELLSSSSSKAANTGVDMSLIYITHHPEEWIPSIKHVLHLQNGKSVYNGSMDDYDPESVEISSNNNNDD